MELPPFEYNCSVDTPSTVKIESLFTHKILQTNP